MISRLAAALTAWSIRWVPDAFVIAVLLTIIVGALAVLWGGTGMLGVVDAWGQGFWKLLEFSMQMCLIMLTGFVLAETKPVRRLLDSVANLATTPKRAVFVMAVLAMTTGLVNWGLSLIGSAVAARAIHRKCPTVDYRLLIACAYLGMSTTWHAGLSASAPLLVATPGHFMEADIGIIPITATIFSPFNMGLVVVTLIVVGALAPSLHPKKEETCIVEPAAIDEPAAQPEDEKKETAATWSDWIETTPWVSLVVVLLAGTWLVMHFAASGLSISLNIVNLIFLALGILLHWTPRAFLGACQRGGRVIWGIVIQFPLYAGIFGMIKYTGLEQALANAFASVTTANTFPLACYWYSGVVNYFVPSGGSKWAIEAPYVMGAAAKLGVPKALAVMSYAWGDMMTDAIQPFWAIPLLGVAKLSFREIMGYLVIVFLVYAAFTSVAFLLAPILGWVS